MACLHLQFRTRHLKLTPRFASSSPRIAEGPLLPNPGHFSLGATSLHQASWPHNSQLQISTVQTTTTTLQSQFQPHIPKQKWHLNAPPANLPPPLPQPHKSAAPALAPSLPLARRHRATRLPRTSRWAYGRITWIRRLSGRS